MLHGSNQELIVSTWRRLGSAAVGAKMLRTIQKVLAERFGENAVPSPAGIARVLADQGAELRHPEIIECDAQWRESQVEREGERFKRLTYSISEQPMNLKQAEALITELERLRQELDLTGENERLTDLTELAVSARRRAQALVRSRVLGSKIRAEQAEIAAWLKVWMQTPNLFADWLELRKRSPEFRKSFVR